MHRVRIDASERLIALGRTGAGKTEWVKAMLTVVNKKFPVVIIDPKALWLGRNPKWAEKDKPGTLDRPRLMTKFDHKLARKKGVQLFQFDALSNLSELNELCYACLNFGRKSGEIFVYFDECEGIASPARTPHGVQRLWKMGRALGVGAWISNQRALGIPEIFKSQAESFVIFDMPGKNDRKNIADYVHTPEIMSDEPIEDYHYWYFHRKLMRAASLMPPLNLGERVKAESVKP